MVKIDRKLLVKECMKEYYREDKKVLIDISLTQVVCSVFYIHNLIFFGNKILVEKETLELLKQLRDESPENPRQEIKQQNARVFLEIIEKSQNAGDKNIEIIDLTENGSNKVDKILGFLKKYPDVIFCTSKSSLYGRLMDLGAPIKQLSLLYEGTQEANPFRYGKICKFETIGAIKFDEKGEMFIHQRGETYIRVYNSNKVLKSENTMVKVNVGNFVLIRGKDKEGKYSFNLYEVVSKHTRNHAIRIIWTDLRAGETRNKYIDRLPYKFRMMIAENICRE